MRSLEKAFLLFGWAADQGHAQAQFYLGKMYEKGEGIGQSDIKSEEWYRKVADPGHVQAISYLGSRSKNDNFEEETCPTAVDKVKTKAEQRNADLLYNHGLMYEKGLGVELSDLKAVKNYRMAANQGHVNAQFRLG